MRHYDLMTAARTNEVIAKISGTLDPLCHTATAF